MQGINPEILKEICEVKMPFGKHAGIVLADLPISYLEWFPPTRNAKRKTRHATFYDL